MEVYLTSLRGRGACSVGTSGCLQGEADELDGGVDAGGVGNEGGGCDAGGVGTGKDVWDGGEPPPGTGGPTSLVCRGEPPAQSSFG